MKPQLENSRLCHLITTFLEHSDLHISTKAEKQLLLSLSKVFKQIQVWSNQFDSDSDSDNVAEVKIPAFDYESSSESACCRDNHDCVTKIIGDMIILLSVESRFVQHLTENILVAISDYFAASEKYWDQFVKSLCICLELAIANSLSCSLDPPQYSKHDMSDAVVALEPRLKRASWSSVACVVRILRTTLKRMKQDIDDELLQIYFNSVSAGLANVPWNVMDQNWKAIRISSDSLEGNGGEIKSRSLFHGTLVQLFCSLVSLSDCEGTKKIFRSHLIVSQINNLLPTLLGWCLGGGSRNNLRMFEYVRHKVLMLMIRLSSLIDLEDSLLFPWLGLIHEYFEDLLLLPMNHPDQEDTLEGSPFISSTCDTNKRVDTSRHLQRLVVLLFLRCSFSLIGLIDRRVKQGCNSSDLTCSCVKSGLSELHWWLQIHLPSKILRASNCYLKVCTSFSISFIRLFIHEDDILFELLLLLFCVPLEAKQKDGQDICASEEMKDDILFHVTNILNPLQLFHLFLSELHYDHQVLLDYLISKNTGAPSAEYLLRQVLEAFICLTKYQQLLQPSLRIVSDSWIKFVEFSLEGKVSDMGERTKISGKKRKVLVDGSDLWVRLGSSTEQDDNGPSSFGKHHQEVILHSDVYSRSEGKPFGKAKDCLLLLEKTIHNLHQKELFPYNPKVLLLRLST